MRKHIKYKHGILSDELYLKIDKILFDGNYPFKDQWIHLRDAVNCGTVTPLEAYDAIDTGYVPEYLLTRESNYSHLV